MALKLYVETTGELVIEKQRQFNYPAYSELTRINNGNGSISISTFDESLRTYVSQTPYTELADKSGVVYPSFQAMWDAITPYFDDQVA